MLILQRGIACGSELAFASFEEFGHPAADHHVVTAVVSELDDGLKRLCVGGLFERGVDRDDHGSNSLFFGRIVGFGGVGREAHQEDQKEVFHEGRDGGEKRVTSGGLVRICRKIHASEAVENRFLWVFL